MKPWLLDSDTVQVPASGPSGHHICWFTRGCSHEDLLIFHVLFYMLLVVFEIVWLGLGRLQAHVSVLSLFFLWFWDCWGWMGSDLHIIILMYHTSLSNSKWNLKQTNKPPSKSEPRSVPCPNPCQSPRVSTTSVSVPWVFQRRWVTSDTKVGVQIQLGTGPLWAAVSFPWATPHGPWFSRRLTSWEPPIREALRFWWRFGSEGASWRYLTMHIPDCQYVSMGSPGATNGVPNRINEKKRWKNGMSHAFPVVFPGFSSLGPSHARLGGGGSWLAPRFGLSSWRTTCYIASGLSTVVKNNQKKTMWKDTTRNQQKAPEIGNRNWKLLEIISGRETSQNSSGKWWRESNGAMTR